MFDIGWSELLVIAVVLIVVVGPKDLPPMLRAFGKMTANLRKMAGEFRTQFDEALRETELDDVRKTISDAKSLNPTNALRDAINPLRQMGQDIRDDLQRSTQAANPGAAQQGLTQTDIEAQNAVEGAHPAGSAPEIPTNFPSPPSAPVAQPPLATPSAPAVAPGTLPAAPAAPGAPPAAAPAPAPAIAEPAAAPKKAPRKSAAKAKAVEPAPAAEPVAEKPKRSRAAKPTVAEPNLVAEAAAAAVEAAEQAPAKPAPRKRAAKKTDVPKDDA